MTKPTCSIYPKSIAWNSVTWDASAGGPLRLDITYGGREIEDRTGDDVYPRSTVVVDGALRVTATLRQFKHTTALGTSAQMVYTFTDSTGSTATVTMPGMRLVSIRSSQDRANPGSAEFTWAHESTDGSTVPIS
jgi:hypothetical protein